MIPTRDRLAYLQVALESIAPQAAQEEAELLVVDDAGPSPGARELAARFGARYEPHERPRGLNAARNTGLERTHGELIVFVDDDVRVKPGWLAALMRAAREHPEVDVFTGPIRPRIEGARPRGCGREGTITIGAVATGATAVAGSIAHPADTGAGIAGVTTATGGPGAGRGTRITLAGRRGAGAGRAGGRGARGTACRNLGVRRSRTAGGAGSTAPNAVQVAPSTSGVTRGRSTRDGAHAPRPRPSATGSGCTCGVPSRPVQTRYRASGRDGRGSTKA